MTKTPIGSAVLVSPGVVRVFVRATTPARPDLVGHFQRDYTPEELERSGWNIERIPTEVGESVPVYPVER